MCLSSKAVKSGQLTKLDNHTQLPVALYANPNLANDLKDLKTILYYDGCHIFLEVSSSLTAKPTKSASAGTVSGAVRRKF